MRQGTMDELIQWPRATYWDKPWNPWIGCVPVSPACHHCYAKTATEDRFGQSFSPHKTRKLAPPQSGVVFVGNMTDMFGGWISPCELWDYLSKLFYFDPTGGGEKPFDATYLFCTKRVQNMVEVLGIYKEVPHAYFGFTAENQEWFDRRSKDAMEMPSHHKLWLSAEPLLGPVDISGPMCDRLKWVAVGCESGPRRRPCKMEWIEDIVDQCVSLGIPVFVKQLDIGGVCQRDITKFPERLQIRQVPWHKKGENNGH